MITIETRTKSGIYPGQPDEKVRWLIVTHKHTVIANLPLQRQSWKELDAWARDQIDLYLEQQIGQVDV